MKKSPAVGVLIENGCFKPSVLTVPIGTMVQWLNKDISPHTVTGQGFDFGPGFDSGELRKGMFFHHQFTAAGDYAYHCAIHPDMKGVVHVQKVVCP